MSIQVFQVVPLKALSWHVTKWGHPVFLLGGNSGAHCTTLSKSPLQILHFIPIFPTVMYAWRRWGKTGILFLFICFDIFAGYEGVCTYLLPPASGSRLKSILTFCWSKYNPLHFNHLAAVLFFCKHPKTDQIRREREGGRGGSYVECMSSDFSPIHSLFMI